MNRTGALALILISLTASCIISVMPAFITVVTPVKAQTDVETSAFISVEPNPAETNQDPVRVTIRITPAPPMPTRVAVTFTRPDGFIIENYYDTNPDGSQNFNIALLMVGNWTLKLSFPGQAFVDTYYLPSESQITFTRLPPPPPPWSTAGNWASKAPMHEARSVLGVAAVNGKIYAIGGSTASGFSPSIPAFAVFGDINIDEFVGTNEEYDPATDMWTYKASMPTPRTVFAIAAYQNKIYCIGGRSIVGSVNGGYTGVNEVYDPATDTWETKAPMPTARGWLQANVVNGKIYLIGGAPNGTLNEVYDPATDTWATKAPMPTGASSYASAVFDNKIYIIGGFSSNLNQIYEPTIDKWSLGAPPPSGVAGGAAVATAGVMAPKRIYIIDMPGAYTPSNQVYNPKNDSWTIGTDLPTNRVNFGVAVVNDTLYVIGGHTYNLPGFFAPSAMNEQYTPIGYGTPDPTYQSPSPSPSPSPAPTQIELIYAAAAGAAATATIIITAVALKKRHKKNTS